MRDHAPIAVEPARDAIAGFSPSNGSAISPGHPEAICDDCGGANVVWFAPSSLWNKIARRPDKSDPMLCPRCFVLRAGAMGIQTSWMIAPGNGGCPTGSDLWEINDLAQRVIKSRQNVGTGMKDQAQRVVGIIQRINESPNAESSDSRP